MGFSKKDEHESYGMVGISRIQCSKGQPLFGSSIKHDSMIRLSVKQANVERDLHREWYHGHECIVEVDLSASQFSQFITNPNVGDGVPCTIRRVGVKRMLEPPYRGQNETFNEELQEKFDKAMNDANDLIVSAGEMLSSKGAMKVSDKRVLLAKLEALVRHINSNIPFLHKQFTRAMDKTVTSAKAEIEEFYSGTIMKLGRKALDKLNKPLIGS